MEINKSEFVISSAETTKCPNDNKPEYAFIGRSNVGKSSLINMLCRHKGLAKTSATPGKTLLINHFIINNEWYILQREQLVNLFVLIDIRHDPQKIDTDFITWLGQSGIPFSIIFTKADKIGNMQKAQKAANKYMDTLKETWEELPPYFVTSSDKALGRDEVLDYIEGINRELTTED